MKLSTEEQNALEIVNVKALQAAFKFLPDVYTKVRVSATYTDFIMQENTGFMKDIMIASVTMPTMICGISHGLFRYSKNFIRTFGYASALQQNPNPQNAKFILLSFLNASGCGTEKYSSKSCLLTIYLAFATMEEFKNTNKVSCWRFVEKQTNMDDTISKQRIKDAVAVLEGDSNKMGLENDNTSMYHL